MAIQFGSLKHTTSGRRRTTSAFSASKRKRYFKRYIPTEVYRRETPDYPSLDTGVGVAAKVDRPKLSSTVTVAPAYNKGAYQVISSENIKDIGR